MAAHDRSELDPTRRTARLSELADLEVADGHADVRGWPVRTIDGTTIGRVADLVVDLDALRVRELDVALTGEGDGRHVRLPVAHVRMAERGDAILVETLPTEVAHVLTGRARASAVPSPAEPPTAERPAAERRGSERLAAGHSGADRHAFDRMPERTEAVERLTLAEERLDVRAEAVPAGHVDVRKRVDVEHVVERVPVTREEVTIERRPLAADAPTEPVFTDDEIRIPLLEERLVIEKRLVAREELVIRKHRVVEHRTVEADLRRERVDIDDATPGGTVRAGGRGDAIPGLADRVAPRTEGRGDARPDARSDAQPGA